MPSLSKIYYCQHIGQGALHFPVLLIHGACSNHLCWPAEIRRQSGLHTVALDLPGHGKSTGAGFHDLRSYSQALFDFISAAGWYRIFLVGHSMGGAIALQFSLDHPDLVLGLGLISSAASFSFRREMVELFRSHNTAELGRLEMRNLIAPRSGETQWFQKNPKSIWDERSSLWYADLRACSVFDVRAHLGNITSPALIMDGTEDPLVPYSAATFMADKMPNASLVTSYQNGHMLMLEEPKTTAAHLNQFLLQNMPVI